MSIEVHDEDDLQAHIMQKIANILLENVGRYYDFRHHAKVRRIAGESISPEIDLLYIPIPGSIEKETIIGYEFKLLKSEKNAVNYRYLYQGISQAIFYFKYGLDISYLVLGISKKISKQNERLLIRKMKHLENILAGRLDSFGVKIWSERYPHRIETCIKHKGNFPFYSFEEYKLNRQNLLAGKFSCDLKFLERHKKKTSSEHS